MIKLWAVRAAITVIVLYFSIAAYGAHQSVWDSLAFAGFIMAIFILGELHQEFRTKMLNDGGNR